MDAVSIPSIDLIIAPLSIQEPASGRKTRNKALTLIVIFALNLISDSNVAPMLSECYNASKTIYITSKCFFALTALVNADESA